MNMEERIDAIIAAKSDQGLSVQQLADMSRISASTVSRTLAKKTAPSYTTISLMEEALGIKEGDVENPILELAGSSPIMQKYLDMQEERLARMRAHYNMLLSEKNRWVKYSMILNIVLMVFIFLMLALDAIHPDIGWIRSQFGL